jgi:DNA-binding phage protein
MAIETTRWDILDHLKTKEDIADYLEAVIEEGDPEFLKDGLGTVARTLIAKEAGLPPLPDDTIKALSLVLRTLGIGLAVAREAQAAE